MFTPKGDVITLPAESTPVDFAYAVHTEVGHRCIGSRVNGRLVALERKLESGDVVEIFTSKAEGAGPSRDWLAFVASPRAKTKIKQWFAKERREEAIEAGKDAITREARRTSMPLQRLVSADAMAALSHELHFPDLTALYAAVGEGHASARHVVQRLVGAARRRRARRGGARRAGHAVDGPAAPSGGDAGVVVRGDDGDVGDLYTKLARCCTPVPGDDILGFVTRGGGVSVHRTDCTNAGDLQARAERLVDVAWSVSPGSVFLVAIQVEALDRHRLLSDITKVLADEKVNILSASVDDVQRDRVAISRFTLRDGRPEAPRARAAAVRNVEGVYDVYRVTSARAEPAIARPRGRSGGPSAQPTAAPADVHRWLGLPSPGPLASSEPACGDRRRARRRPASSIVPNDGVVRGQLRVAVDQEELAAVRCSGGRSWPSPGAPRPYGAARGTTSSGESCSRGRRVPVPVGSPHCSTCRPGAVVSRWHGVSSK